MRDSDSLLPVSILAKMSTVQRSGVLLVFSRIADPASFSSDTYDDWYNLIHIPDTLNTDGISNAARYRAERDSHEEYPYLALYRVPDMNFLDGKEFGSIAVHHEMLPGPSHSILDVAMFDLRRYIRVHNFVQGNGLRQASMRPTLHLQLYMRLTSYKLMQISV